MVSPTYYNACRIFEDSGFHSRLRAVPEDEEGLDIEYLKQAMDKSEARAIAEGNTKPVEYASKCTECLAELASLDSQTTTTMEQDISASHLRCSYLQQPFFYYHEPATSSGARSTGT